MSVKSLEAELRAFDSKVEDERMALVQRIENAKAIEKMNELKICPPKELFKIEIYKGINIVKYNLSEVIDRPQEGSVRLQYQVVSPHVKGNMHYFYLIVDSQEQLVNSLGCKNNIFLNREEVINLFKKTIDKEELRNVN